MNVLALSDLHMYDQQRTSYYKIFIESLVKENDIDLIVITGDIFEGEASFNPYKRLAHVTGGVKTICTLGNHEFFYNKVSEVLDYYGYYYNPRKYDVHYLDIVDFYDVGDFRFVGNVLWYDGSMKSFPDQDMDKFADFRWSDCTIKDFDWAKENKKCIEQIRKGVKSSDGKRLVLCTHTVPHIEMNKFRDEPNEYNAYSGMNDLFAMFPEGCGTVFEWSFCGHTHRREIGRDIHGCCCVNVGNNYNPPYEYFIMGL